MDAYQQVFGKLNLPESAITPSLNTDQLVQMLEATKNKVAGQLKVNAERMLSDAVSPISSTERPPPSKRSRASSPKKEKQP